MIRSAVLVAAALLAANPLCAALTPQQRQLNIDSFEYVWKTIRDKHWQVRPGGLDWQAIHAEFRPKMEKADSMDAARAVLNEMLGRLHQTHFAIVPSELYSDLGSTPNGYNGTGLDVRVIHSQVLVTSVDPGSPAEAQGIRPGWQILTINGVDLAPVIEKLDTIYAHSTLRELISRRAILARLGGPVALQLSDAGLHVTKALASGTPKGARVQFGYLDPGYVWIESSRVGNGNIGLVRFNLFLDAEHIMKKFGEAVESCRNCDGFIIDLRGNPGGIGVMAMGIAGWFIDKPGERLGTLYLRESTLKFVVNPRLHAFPGPLAILVDGASASTSEILAEGLKDLGRARVFGTRTAAAALPSVFEKLPNGDGFQYAIANYISEGGQPLEGRGVTPDVETPVTREALLEGKDPPLDAAIEWIEQRK
ncbi:MAG TPA: S41 family peptidase [Bryobacteraceae bacterium]|nr:S41 family peptidase [Bryobacteraceae bacterium]HUO32268.1 S41 family peptidase [Bryobacteraceae bacterium]